MFEVNSAGARREQKTIQCVLYGTLVELMLKSNSRGSLARRAKRSAKPSQDQSLVAGRARSSYALTVAAPPIAFHSCDLLRARARQKVCAASALRALPHCWQIGVVVPKVRMMCSEIPPRAHVPSWVQSTIGNPRNSVAPIYISKTSPEPMIICKV